MSNVGWYIAGFLSAQIVYLISANTPERALANLHAWWHAIMS